MRECISKTMKSWTMIFGTYLRWVGAPTPQNNFRPRCTPKAPPKKVKIGRNSCFGTHKWGTQVCLWGAHNVGPFWGPNRPYQKYIIFQSQLLTPKTRFCRSISTDVAEYAITFFRNITVEYELKNIWWCLRAPVTRQLCFLMEFCISFRDLFAPIGNPLILYAVLLHPLGTVHGFVIGGPTEKANVCGRGSILSRTTVGTLFTNSGKRNHRK